MLFKNYNVPQLTRLFLAALVQPALSVFVNDYLMTGAWIVSVYTLPCHITVDE